MGGGKQLDRAAGLAVVLFGFALLWLIIPAHIEYIDAGWVKPETVPSVVGYVLILAGIIQAVAPTGAAHVEVKETIRAALFLLLGAAAVYLMGRFGFLYTAPGLVLIIMLLIGERRLIWLLAGVIAAPGLIWFIAEKLLQRPLP